MAEESPERNPVPAEEDREALERQQALGVRLKTLFDTVVDEPLPDDLLQLLEKLGDGGDTDAKR